MPLTLEICLETALENLFKDHCLVLFPVMGAEN
jgi:hypothetical protein